MEIWIALFQKQMKDNDHMRKIYDWSYMFLLCEKGTKIPSSLGDFEYSGNCGMNHGAPIFPKWGTHAQLLLIFLINTI